MVAGRYQAIFSAWKMLPWQNPVAVWQIFSHKYFRPLIPFAMIIALVSNLLALFSDGSFNKHSWLMLSSPYQWILLVLQVLFYLSAWIGSRYKFRGAIGKLMYMATFLVNSNVAALRGFYRYITSKQTVVWKKAAR
jgi:hypothetical protein